MTSARLRCGHLKILACIGGAALMLGVVEENIAALRFWQALGFTLQSTSAPRPFGKKMQVVYVMRREIIPETSRI